LRQLPFALSILFSVSAGAAALEIDSLVDLARSAPAEVAADALIRIASTDKMAPKRAVDLLQEAFALASAAPEPYKRRADFDHAQGPPVYLTRVYSQDLDRQSLQLRAVEGLLALSPAKAREFFEQIPPLELPAVTCDDFLVYDVSRFYDVLGRVAATTFDPKETREGEPARFLARYVGGTTSAVQIAPAARLLANVALSDSEFLTLLTSFAGALSRISGDDRSFTYGVREAGPEIVRLIQFSAHRGASPLFLIEAYRQFLVNNLSAVRCADHKSQIDSAPAFFNENLSTAQVQPLGEKELMPAKLDGEAKGAAWCENPECRAMRQQFTGLIRRDNGEVYQVSQREQTEWQIKVRDLLNSLAAWTQSTGATPVEHFREMIGFYNDLLAIIPNGSTREFVLRSFLNYLSQAQLPPENRIEWLFPIRQLVGRVRLDPQGLGRLADDLSRSNAVIALYIALEHVAPRSINEVMPML